MYQTETKEVERQIEDRATLFAEQKFVPKDGGRFYARKNAFKEVMCDVFFKLDLAQAMKVINEAQRVNLTRLLLEDNDKRESH